MKRILIFTIGIALLGFTACNQSGKKETEAKKEISLAYVDGWAEGVAITHVTKHILETQGYTVDVKAAAVDLIFASMAQGDVDAFMDVWMPVTHKTKIARFEGKIERLGVINKNAKIGLVVPAYVPVNSLEDLNENADLFDGKIIGIGSGAGITAKTNLAIEDYALDFEQLNSSGIAMLSELKKAVDAKKPIVVALWAPHWAFGSYELKFLDDPKQVFGAAESIETYARTGLKNEDPFAAAYFKNFKLNDAQLSDLLTKMKNGENKEAIAKAWVLEHKELVDSFIPKAK